MIGDHHCFVQMTILSPHREAAYHNRGIFADPPSIKCSNNCCAADMLFRMFVLSSHYIKPPFCKAAIVCWSPAQMCQASQPDCRKVLTFQCPFLEHPSQLCQSTLLSSRTLFFGTVAYGPSSRLLVLSRRRALHTTLAECAVYSSSDGVPPHNGMCFHHLPFPA